MRGADQFTIADLVSLAPDLPMPLYDDSCINESAILNIQGKRMKVRHFHVSPAEKGLCRSIDCPFPLTVELNIPCQTGYHGNE